MKDVEYGGGYTTMQQTFNNRMKVATFELDVNSVERMKKAYTYDATAHLTTVDDQLGTTEFSHSTDNQDRAMTYDHAGRMTTIRSGLETHGSTDTANHLPVR